MAPPSQRANAPKWQSWYVSIAVVVLNTLLLFVVLEGVSRLVLKAPSFTDQQETLDTLLRTQAWGDQFVQDYRKFQYRLEPHPYVGFKHAQFESQTINIGADGFRVVPGVEASDKVPKTHLEVMALGGSTMMGVGAPDDGTIPAYLQHALSERHSAPVRVLNRGVGFWVSTQELVYLTLELRKGNVPDIVVFYHGLNDVARAVEYGQAGIPRLPPIRNCPVHSRFLLAVLGAVRRAGVRLDERPCVDPPEYPLPPMTDAYVHWPEADKWRLAHETVSLYLQNVEHARTIG